MTALLTEFGAAFATHDIDTDAARAFRAVSGAFIETVAGAGALGARASELELLVVVKSVAGAGKRS